MLALVIAAVSAVVASDNVKARLVTDVDAVAPGLRFEAAIVLEPAPGWYTYWREPGDAGMATSVEWKLPRGFTAEPVQWPRPRAMKANELVTSHGYDGDVWLLATIRAPAKPPKRTKLEAQVTWMECREVCLPGSATLTVGLPRTTAATADASDADAFAAARARLPRMSPGWPVDVTRDGRRIRLSLTTPEGVTLGADTHLFVEQPGIVEPSAAQTLTAREGGGYVLEVTAARTPANPHPDAVDAVLASGDGAWRLRIPIPSPEKKP